MSRKRAVRKAKPEAETPDYADIAAAVRALAEAHAPTRAQLEQETVPETEEPTRAAPDKAKKAENARGIAHIADTAPPPEAIEAIGDEVLEPEAEAATQADAEAAAEHARHKRMVEALLFAAEAPLSTEALRRRMPEGADVSALLAQLQDDYAERGVNLARVAGKWRFQTAPELSPLLRENKAEPRKLSRAALETLAIIAYHQPATRPEIEAVRGVATSKGTLDVLLELGWVRPRGRRRAPGRPLVYVTTDAFLEHFGLDGLEDLPGKADLKAQGLLDDAAPDDFEVPDPTLAGLGDELPLEGDADDAGLDGAFHTDYLEGDDASGDEGA